jgi:sulfonate transport system ATP-binding protein
MTGLVIQSVNKSYRANGRTHAVLRDVSLAVGEQEIVGILGASGCGKSTLLRLAMGLDRDYAGSIRVHGREISGVSAGTSIVFQDHRLFPWLTVHDNVDLALDVLGLSAAERARRVRHYVDLVGLADFAQAYPRQLSGGMAQRAAIARALVTEPEILLMDEPFGALDSLLRLRLQDELLRIWEKHRIAIVIVTHDVEEALYLSDRVLVMEANPGRVRDIIPITVPRANRRGEAALLALKRQALRTLLPETANA